MRKNVLALSIAAMIGGLAAGAANAAVLTQNTISGARVGSDASLPLITALTGYTDTTATILEPTTTGIGHIMLVPYFSTQGNNKLLLNITNTDGVNGKIVKVRFRGASNSDDILDFTVYMSPSDMWTANVDSDGTVSQLSTQDKSCVLPTSIGPTPIAFPLARVKNGNPAQTREGYVEILNEADILPNSALFAAIKHNNGVPSCDPAVMANEAKDVTDQAVGTNGFSTAGPDNAFARGYGNPSGQLFANWAVVNPATQFSQSGQATAIRANDPTDVTAGLTNNSGNGNIVFFPQVGNTPSYATGPTGDVSASASPAGTAPTTDPTTGVLSDGTATTNAARFTADPLLAAGSITVYNVDFPDLSTPYLLGTTGVGAAATVNDPTVVNGASAILPTAQADALTQSLATTAITNEFATSAGIATDWVFSQPTRRYHVAVLYGTTDKAVYRRKTSTALTDGLEAYYTPGNTSLIGSVVCLTKLGTLAATDREEQTAQPDGFSISPIVPGASFNLCGETSVLSFNGTTVYNSQLNPTLIDVSRYAQDGWMSIGTPSATSFTAHPDKTQGVQGLPVVGYAAVSAGLQLSGTWPHRTSGR